MNVRVDPDGERLIRAATRDGRYHAPEEVVARALETLAESESTGSKEETRRQAVQDMLEFAATHHFTLGEGLRFRNLLHEEHKF
jgi:Arc/MetJ-type ribon-helix-helix transcriptional regulator